MQCPKGARPKRGGAPAITDIAGRHKSGIADEHLGECGDVGVPYLPVATPELSAVESVWRDAKYGLMTSEYYEALEDLRYTVSEYFGTCPIGADIYTYLERSL